MVFGFLFPKALSRTICPRGFAKNRYQLDSRLRGNDDPMDSRLRGNDEPMDSRLRENDEPMDSRLRENDES